MTDVYFLIMDIPLGSSLLHQIAKLKITLATGAHKERCFNYYHCELFRERLDVLLRVTSINA